MNILILAHRIPYPPNKGDKIRSFNIIKYLSQQHDIYLITTLDEEADTQFIPSLKEYCKEVYAHYFSKQLKIIKGLFSSVPFSVLNFYDTKIQHFVDDTLEYNDIGAIICFCSSMAEYIFLTPKYKSNDLEAVSLIIDFVDLDSDKWSQFANYSSFPRNLIFKEENKRLFKFEKKINNSFNHSIFVSLREVKAFKKLYPEALNSISISNGVDTSFFFPASPCNEDITKKANPVLLFPGFMDYFANEDGVIWFCDKIFPQIKKEFPTTEFYIVGNQPTDLVWNLSEIDGITVTGYVEDIRSYYWMADVVVIPLRIARGLQNKILEAMATANAIVATSNASDGIICNHNENILIADNESSFANQVIELLNDEERKAQLAGNAVSNIIEHYSWNQNLKKLDDLLNNDSQLLTAVAKN